MARAAVLGVVSGEGEQVENGSMLNWYLVAIICLGVGAAGFGIWHRYRRSGRLAADNAAKPAHPEGQACIQAQSGLARHPFEFRMVLENLPGHVSLMNSKVQYVWANSSYRNWLGIKDDNELIGKSLHEVLGAERYEAIQPHVERVLSGELVAFDSTIAISGEERNVQAMYVPDFANGRVVGFIALIVEFALQHSLERLQIVLDSISDAVITLDVDGKVVTINPVAERLTEFDAAKGIGTHVDSVLQITRKDGATTTGHSAFHILNEAIDAGRAENLDLVSLSGQQYPIVLRGTSLRSASGEAFGSLITFQDRTQENLLQEQLRLSEKVRAVGVVAGGIAHEFNNLLGIISGAATMITLRERQKMGPESANFIDTIERSVDRAASLIQKLTVFAGDGDSDLAVFHINDVVQDVVEILDKTLDQKTPIVLEEGISDGRVLGNSISMQNALLNICINAAHSLDGAGTVSIRTRTIWIDENERQFTQFKISSGRYHEISISDDGIGIDGSDLSKIFDPFFTTKGSDKGSGLGLAMVYKTIVDHKGAIEVESKLQNGSTFTVLLPQAEKDIEVDAHKSAPKERPRGREGLILLVDDEVDFRNNGKAILEILGFKVLVASNGQEALRLFSENKEEISHVLTDLNMPGMNGVELIGALSKQQSECRFVIVTGFSEMLELDKLKEIGVQQILCKPFKIEQLEAAIS